MKKRTVITTETREVWVIRQAQGERPEQDSPAGGVEQSETRAPAVRENTETEKEEGSNEEK